MRDSDSPRGRHRLRLERFARNEHLFPGGDHPTGNCSACARLITSRFGGEVRGYTHTENPAARVGEVEGGHDFALTPDGFLVDPWLYHYYGERPVLDLRDERDRVEALARYGPEENWERLPGRAQSPPGFATEWARKDSGERGR